jgi:asparagine synthase (glutamine-hydrolysing)
MCGIAGLASAGGVSRDDEAVVVRMLESLAHRGPDDQHYVADAYAIIGSRRLSIIDLDTGRQPLGNEDDSIQISQNGEIYNYVELRDELIRRGHTMSTHGDTEMIAHLYEEFGIDFVRHLRGMFAIAISDRRRRRLVLARDRLGKKPLYWRLADGVLTWGSELKAILADPRTPRRVDQKALALFLQYQYVPAPWSILEGVQKLSPASVLVWDGGEPVISRYWTPDFEPKRIQSREEDEHACLELLRESVRIRLRSDVPVGAFLSGGMDSSTVVALMAEASPQPVRTFSIGFEEPEFDELPYARAVARHFATDHTEDVVRLDAIALLPELAEHFDEPFGDSSAVPTFRVAQMAARHLKVVLTGDGGDEAFGGYQRYRFQGVLQLGDHLPLAVRQGLVGTAQTVLGRTMPRSRLRRRMDAWGNLVEMPPDDRYVRLMEIFGPQLRHDLLGDRAPNQDGYLAEVMSAGPRDPLDRMLRADTLTYLPEDLLVKVDRATMANSLEARAPLLDHHVIEFAARLPTYRKIQRGVTKVILRDVAKSLMPARLVDRPKRGFGVPIGSWFRSELGARFEEVALAPDAALRDHLDQGAAAKLLAEHRAGRHEHGHRLWSLLMFELWARRWLAPRPAESAEGILAPAAGSVDA